MVNHWPNLQRRHAIMMAEAITALAILAFALMPLTLGIQAERLKLRQSYHRAVALELLDGELELLHAGLAHRYPPGTYPDYPVHGDAVTSLPPGHITLTVSATTLTLAWQPIGHGIPCTASAPLPRPEAQP